MSYKPADLFLALITGKYDLVKPIVESGLDLNFKLRSQTPLYIAICYNCCAKIIELLLSRGADVNKTCCSFARQNEPPLVAASRMSLYDIFRVLLQAPGLKINRGDFLGVGALYWAVYNNDIEMITLLLNHKADINVGTSPPNCPFFISVQRPKERIEVIRLLIRYGCTRERYFFPDGSSVHILYRAIQTKKKKTLELLLRTGFRGNQEENLSFRKLCAAWDEELSDKMWSILINPLSLKNIAMITIRKILVCFYGNLRKNDTDRLPVPETIKEDLWLV